MPTKLPIFDQFWCLNKVRLYQEIKENNSDSENLIYEITIESADIVVNYSIEEPFPLK